MKPTKNGLELRQLACCIHLDRKKTILKYPYSFFGIISELYRWQLFVLPNKADIINNFNSRGNSSFSLCVYHLRIW